VKTTLAYGMDGLAIDVPDHATVVETHVHPAIADPVAAMRQAFRLPRGARPLRESVRAGQRVAISICDGTRPQPRREMLAAILAELEHVPPQDIVIFVATGTHRGNTAAELEAMLGSELRSRHRVVNHDARDAATLAPAGVTRSGVRALLNKEFLASDVRITTGTVEPHFFAGFSGGPKMVAPGLASIDTVLTLHDASRIGHPKATWGITEGNPIHDDVRDIARMVGVDFAVDVTLNQDKQIAEVFAGELFAEHRAACAAAQRDAMAPVRAAFDVVLTSNSGFPLDQNRYQAVKGMSAAARVVKPGGTIICAAECRDGIPAHGSFAEVLASAASPAALLSMINAPGYCVPDQWQVQIAAMILGKARVLMKADGLRPEQIRAAHLEPVADLQQALDDALRRAGPDATLCVLPQGPRVIPYLR
jgi:lactate racemase